MQMVNTKSLWKPFEIVPPDGVSSDFYNNEKSYFTFECWNHWPVAQIASSDRPCVTNDRPSHSSLSHLFWNMSAETEDTATKILMDGLTTKGLRDLVPLARSWASPPQLKVEGGAVQNAGYDASERAYVLTEERPGKGGQVRLTLEASETSPLAHAALLIRGWGESTPEVRIDGRPVTPGPKLRTAHLHHLDRTDLLIWIAEDASRQVRLELRATTRNPE